MLIKRSGPVDLPPVTMPTPGFAVFAQGSAREIAAAAATSNTVAAQTSLISGLGAWIPVSYGINRFAGLVSFYRKRSDTGAQVFDLVGGEGEIDAVNSVEVNNQSLRAGCSYTVYRGLASQAVDGTVAAALANSLPTGTYADALHGIFHVVVSLAAGAYTAAEFKGFDITFRGRKVFDIRDATQNIMTPSTWKYSTNGALVRADFLSSGNARARGVRPRFGRGLICDHAASMAAYNWCDTLVGVYPNQQKRAEFHGTFLNPQSDSTNDALLKTASMAFVDVLGDTFTLIPDMPRSPVFFIDNDAMGKDNILVWERVNERRADTVPTVIEGSLPDISKRPWGTKKFRVVHPYVLTGQLPEVVENAEYSFCRTLSAAQRFATQRLNMKQLGSRAWGVRGGPDMLALQVGDLLSATHSIGMSNKLWVTQQVTDGGQAKMALKLSEYDPAMYANNVVTEPTTSGDGSLNCDTYPAISAMTASERSGWEPASGGGYACTRRAQLVWTVGYYPCLAHYQVELSQSGTVLESTTTGSASFLSMPLTAGSYTMRVRLVSSVPGMAAGAWSTTTVTITSTACMPEAPRGVWITGTRVYQEFTSPPYDDFEARVINIDTAISPVTHTEVWFGGASATFATATLKATLSGARTSIPYGVHTDSGASSWDWFVDFDGVSTNAGDTSMIARPTMPEKVWIRFKNGSAVSLPVMVVCSEANRLSSAMRLHGVIFLAGDLRTLDGTWLVPNSGDTRVFTANSGSAPFITFTALAGTLTYAYLGGTNQQIDGGLYDSFGDPTGGLVVWQASSAY